MFALLIASFLVGVAVFLFTGTWSLWVRVAVALFVFLGPTVGAIAFIGHVGDKPQDGARSYDPPTK